MYRLYLSCQESDLLMSKVILRKMRELFVQSHVKKITLSPTLGLFVHVFSTLAQTAQFDNMMTANNNEVKLKSIVQVGRRKGRKNSN